MEINQLCGDPRDLHAIELPQLRGRRRLDGVGRPNFDFHTGIAEFERRNCQDRDAYVTASAPVTAMGANAAGSPKQLRELFHLAVELEKAALADDYFVSRK